MRQHANFKTNLPLQPVGTNTGIFWQKRARETWKWKTVSISCNALGECQTYQNLNRKFVRVCQTQLQREEEHLCKKQIDLERGGGWRWGGEIVKLLDRPFENLPIALYLMSALNVGVFGQLWDFVSDLLQHFNQNSHTPNFCICIRGFVYSCIRVFVCSYIRVFVFMYLCICVFMYSCIHVFVYSCICIGGFRQLWDWSVAAV